MGRQYFGTDGIRGRVGQAPITADFVLKLGWAAGKVFSEAEKGRKLILVGKDTRVSGYMFESALQAGIIAAGVDVGLLGPMPTPAIAYLTRTFRAQAGVVISASHNPFDDNGIKFFGGDGFKLGDEVESRIEHYLDQPMETGLSEYLGRANRIADAAGRYIEFCKSTVPSGFNLDGLKIVVDCANGATYHVAPDVLRELGASVTTIAVEPDGLNINRECGSNHPRGLASEVLRQKADLGIAFDGDGDRVVMVDSRGVVLDGDEILYIIASHRHSSLGGCDGVVGTLMSNHGLKLAFDKLAIPFERARVGDRYVIESMRKNGWKLGGESSGHIVCSDLTSTGDGIVAALQVLKAMSETGKTLAELSRQMEKLPQVMINVRMKEKVAVVDLPEIRAAVVEAEAALAGNGRVLLRPSGTEPLIRVMVEGVDQELVNRLARQVADTVEKVLL
ncbi:MAG: phosphoglucosamine mutase [Gammaproteobacteria bacterium BRH_c0]|nr:MAG: phosphoglucosamine mutase [Gammaproteobacteria bacterium BRH_c0]